MRSMGGAKPTNWNLIRQRKNSIMMVFKADQKVKFDKVASKQKRKQEENKSESSSEDSDEMSGSKSGMNSPTKRDIMDTINSEADLITDRTNKADEIDLKDDVIDNGMGARQSTMLNRNGNTKRFADEEEGEEFD